MLATRLIDLIETHADAMTREAIRILTTDPRTPNFRNIPPGELEMRVFRLYHNLSRWIGDPRDDAVRADYEDWGRRRYRQGFRLSEIICGIQLLKQLLRRFIRDHGLVELSGKTAAPAEILPVHLFGIQELNALVGEFFDKALYHLAAGYEAEAASAPPQRPA